MSATDCRDTRSPGQSIQRREDFWRKVIGNYRASLNAMLARKKAQAP